jgi:hypothetical protein
MVFSSTIFYVAIAYDLDRVEFFKFAALYVALFFLYYKIIQFEKWNFKFLLISGILFRLAFLFHLPNLSQDFYRFIWDGELVSNFINPYLFTPNQIINQSALVIDNAQKLIEGMGELSPKFHSNYPPLNQLVFAIAALVGGKSILGSVIVMRIGIIAADIGIIYFGRKLLKNLNLSPHLIFWYFLNPLVILELTGNLHFEGVMLFFFVWSVYLLSKNKWQLAGVIYALSIATKLLPLLFLPLFFKYLGIKKSILFYVIIGLTILLLFLPFYSPEFITNYFETVGLWFSNFEFNASVYNVVKKIGVTYFDAKPWELIKTYGKITPYIIIGVVLLFSLFRKNEKLTGLINSMLWVMTIYYILSAIVHPWYIVFLVFLSIFTRYRFALLWSGFVILSYWAYSNPDYKEHLGLLWFEYLAIFAFISYEINILFNKK